jgi:ABC-2 type transport system permease protein
MHHAASLFHHLRWVLLRNSAATLLRGSPVRVCTIVACCVLIWGTLFAGSIGGFLLLQQDRIPFGGGIVGMVFDFMFLALAVMLVFSTAIILYSSLFSSAETAFLLTTPAGADRIFAYKFQGAVAFSSWSFLLLGAPVLLAYGVVSHAQWPFYVLLPFFFVGFVLLPGSLGALASLLVVNFLPRKPKQIVVTAMVAILLVAGIWVYRVLMSLRTDNWNRDVIQDLISQISFAQGTLVPSHWMTRGIQAAARGDLAEAAYRLALVWSNGLFFYVLAAWAAVRLYRRGYNRVATGGLQRRRYGGAWLDRSLAALVRFLDPQTRLLIIKDFRTFRRDPAQWAQILIFTGLLTLYFVNTRHFYQQDFGKPYKNGISLLNLASTGLLMCAYTGRFIYPMLSLEGRKFWILGLLPLRRERLLWGKFAFSATGALLISEFLILVSDFMMEMPPVAVALHALTVAVLGIGLSGLSVGLGAWMPNFRESDPSKIAIGFGGTMNLISGLTLLLVVVGLMSVPWHLYAAFGDAADLIEVNANGWIVLGVALGTAVGLAAAVVPLRIGRRVLQRMEF